MRLTVFRYELSGGKDANGTGHRQFGDHLKDDGKFIKGVLKAKTDMVMETFSVTKAMEFTDETLFFGNGYQSWSTSKEYS